MLETLPKVDSETTAPKNRSWVMSRLGDGEVMLSSDESLMSSLDSQALRFDVNTVTNSISALFVAKVASVEQIERILWRRENNRIRVWTILNQPDELVENQIYKAQIEVMDTLPREYSFDHSVVFRQDKAREVIFPIGAIEVFVRK